MKTNHNLWGLALVLVASIATGADREQFTLKDGRVIVGTYDEVTQTLVMESPKASLHVDARDIVKREEAPALVAPRAIAEKDVAAAEKPAPAGPPGARTAVAAMKAAHEHKRKADQERDAAQEEEAAAWQQLLTEFRKQMDYNPVPIRVPENPSKRDLDRAQEVQRFNDQLEDAQRHLGKKRIDREFMGTYARFKNVPWILDALDER